MNRVILRSFTALSILMLILSLPAAADFPTYSVIDLGTASGATSRSTGISPNGHVSVDYRTPTAFRTFVWYSYTVKDLGSPFGISPADNASFGVNDHGDLIGEGLVDDSGVSHAFIYQDGVVTDIGTLGEEDVHARGIANGGCVSGWSVTPENRAHAFVWTDGLLTDLGTIGGDESLAFGMNNRGQVVGESRTSQGDLHAFIYLPYPAYGLAAGVPQDLGTLPGGTYTSARAISKAGHVVGGGDTATKLQEAFIWQREWNGTNWVPSFTEIGSLPGADLSFATSVNSSGQVIGEAAGPVGSALFFWQEPDGITALDTLIGGAVSQWRVIEAAGINDQGWIAATGVADGGQPHAILLVPATGPVNVSLTPNSGTLVIETKLTFTAVYSDPKGAGNLSNCYLLINPTADPVNAAYFRYDVKANKLFVANDSATGWMGGFAPGTVGKTVANGYGRLYYENTTVAKSGNTVTVNWTIALKSPYSRRGNSNGFMRLTNLDGMQAGWDKLGAYSVVP